MPGCASKVVVSSVEECVYHQTFGYSANDSRRVRCRPSFAYLRPCLWVSSSMRVGSLWEGGTFRKGPGYIWKIVRDGSVQHWTDLPDAVFINSCTLDPNRHTLLACESLMGRILAINLGAPGRWSAWLTDGRLKPNHPQFPGAPTASRFGTAGPGSASRMEPHSAHTVEADGRPDR